MSGFLKAILALLPTLIQWLKDWGAREERARQKRKADALEEHYEQIGSDNRSVDDAVERLRLRNKPDRGGVP